MSRFILAHDLGTSGNKATLFTTDGKLLKSVTVPYGTHYFNTNWAEQDPDDWWRAVCSSTVSLVEGVNARDLAAICFSGQMMGCLCVDRGGKPLRPAILYSDQRAVKECNSILEKIDAREFYRITGHRASASYSVEKLMWVKNHEPDVYRRTFRMLHAKDYLNFRLTGVMATEYSDASGTNVLDLNTRRWSEKLVAITGIDGEKLPTLKASTDVVGTLTAEAATSLGLVAGHPRGGRRRRRGVRRRGGGVGEARHHVQLSRLLLLDRHHDKGAHLRRADAHVRLGARGARVRPSRAGPCRPPAARTPG